MSHAYSATSAHSAVQSILKAASAKLTGKTRGPDQGEGRRVPRAGSFEENDPRAKPWRKIGDGSVGQGKIHCEVLLKTARDLRHQLNRDFPRAEISQRKVELAEAKAELADLQARSPAEAPIGRPAALQMTIDKHTAWLAKADNRLTPHDLSVLDALLSFVDFATGALFPTIAKIAAKASISYNGVVNSLRRLREHGLIAHVRRTTRTGNKGMAGPQLEQTSNAYFFDHRRKMASRVWKAYWQSLTKALRRLGAHRPSAPVLSIIRAAAAPLTPYQAAFASLGASVAEREHTE
jgi:hypothetical protein